MNEIFKTSIETNVVISDAKTGQVLVNKANQIHPGNMAIAIARGLAASPKHQIFKMKLGNQGTYIDATRQIVFRPPNVMEMSADLYNPTYAEIVDDTNANAGTGNSVNYTAVPNSTNARVIITATISANEAVNRPTDEADSATPTPDPETDAQLDPEGQFFFDELGLFTAGTNETSTALIDSPAELMLTHLIFSPIEHTGSRELSIVYTLLISVS